MLLPVVAILERRWEHGSDRKAQGWKALDLQCHGVFPGGLQMMTKMLTILNLLTTAILFVLLMQARTQLVATQTLDRTIRTQHIEIANSEGKVAASFGYDEKAHVPFLEFYDKDGHRSMMLVTNDDGHTSMYFLSKDYGPTVAVGYLASDVGPEPGAEDPGGWGIRVRSKAGEKDFSYFPSDPASKERKKDSIEPGRSPSK